MQKNNLKIKYEKEVKSKLAELLKIKNEFAIPKITKIVVNMGIGDLAKDKEKLNRIVQDLSMITGQKPKMTRARISVAGFNLRAGQIVGLTTTLRGLRMYSFLEKLITIVLPRLRDFRGIPLKGFDKNGNYTLGIEEHTVFPEIDIAKVDKPKGLELTIVTTAKNPEEGKILLELLGLPFEKK
jgi:large subunit ribosomal protein L5